MLSKQEVAARIAKVALLRGTFTLRSGRTSNYYLDKYLFSTVPEVLAELGTMFAEFCGDVDRLAGAELGGIPLVTAASLASGKPSIFIRKAAKDYGTAKQLEGVLNPGDRVLLVEDVCTTGGQVLEAAEIIQAQKAHVAAIVATIDREEGAREAIEAKGFRFEALFSKSELLDIDAA